MVSEEDWNAIVETLHLLSIPGMGESIKENSNRIYPGIPGNLIGKLEISVHEADTKDRKKSTASRLKKKAQDFLSLVNLNSD